MLIKFLTFASAFFCIKVYFTLLQQCKRNKEKEKQEKTKIDEKMCIDELEGII